MRWLVLRLFAFFVAGSFLVACSEPTERSSFNPRFKLPSDLTFDEVVKQLPVVDENAVARGVQVPSAGTPLGVLVTGHFKGYGLCSTSHPRKGLIVANAHCVVQNVTAVLPAKEPIENVRVVFYDKSGRRRVVQPERYVYVGNLRSDDISVMALSAQDAEEWDTIGGTVVDTEAEIGANPPVAHEVRIWSFSPFTRSVPGEIDTGMRFTPNRCWVSRTKYKIKKLSVQWNGQEQEAVLDIGSGILHPNEAQHLFIDECENRIIGGNSGSLITSASDPRALLGTQHWVIEHVQNAPNSSEFIFPFNRRPDNQVRETTWRFSVGTAFGSFLLRHPEVSF